MKREMPYLFQGDAPGLTIGDLLNAVVEEGERMRWSILSFDSRGDLSALGTDIPSLIQEVSKSETGMKIEWEALRTLADSVHDVVEMTVAGTESGHPFRTADDESFFANCEVAFEVVDCSEWTIFARDSVIAGRIEKLLQSR